MTIKSGISTALVIVGVIAVALILGNIVSFLTSRDRLPNSTTVGDVDVSGLNVSDAISRTSRILLSPVALKYQSTLIQLDPAAIDYQLNDVVLRFQLDKVIADQRSISKMPDYVLRRTSPVHLAVPYQYSQDKLTAYMASLAHDNDRAVQPPQPNATSLQLSAGQDGTQLNRDEAQRLLLDALQSGTSRIVDLPVDVVPNGTTTLKSLGELIKARLAKFSNGVAGVYVKDLKSGDVFTLNGDVAFSAQGWLKFAIALEALRSASQNSTPSQALIATV
ncbi:MAG TPA: hypothetical protein VGK87_16200, partial [Anaerolineae bacterium]